MSWPTLTRTVLAAALIVFACQGAAVALPAGGGVPDSLSFQVLRDGEPIGSHRIQFERKGDALAVKIRTRIAVRLPLVNIAVYRFEHDGWEVWRAGQLAELRSQTNDDGTPHHLEVIRRQGELVVDGDAGAHESPVDIVPASLWNPRIVQGGRILNTLDGREMAVEVVDLGMESVAVPSGTIAARHFKLTGDLERELWFDSDSRLVQVQFKGSDGSDILYSLN